MKFWNYIAEFWAFRWLSGKPGQKKHNAEAVDRRTRDADDDYCVPARGKRSYNSTSSNRRTYSERSYNRRQSFDDFHEEQDDYDMLDDF